MRISDIRAIELDRGSKLDFGPGCHLDILWTPPVGAAVSRSMLTTRWLTASLLAEDTDVEPAVATLILYR